MSLRRYLEKKKIEYGFSRTMLQIIAIFAMIVDHSAYVLIKCGKLYGYDQVLYENAIKLSEAESWLTLYKMLRCFGRISFPIFAFLLVEGFCKTSNLFKYFIRLLLLAFFSEIPYDLMISNRAFYFNVQNVVFTYVVGLLMLLIMKHLKNFPDGVSAVPIIVAAVICYFLKTDYWLEGILLMAVFYKFRHDTYIMCFLALIITAVMSYENYYCCAALSVFFIYFYTGRNGIIDLRRIPYLIYPMHMIALYGVLFFSYIKL